MLDHYDPKWKVNGASLCDYLTQHLDRTVWRWNKDIIMTQLWHALHSDDADVISHAVPALCRAVQAVHAPDAEETHRALALLINGGLSESRGACREVYAQAVECMVCFMQAFACAELFRGVDLCGALGRGGGERGALLSLRLLGVWVRVCWARAGPHMAGIMQVALHTYLTHRGKPYSTRLEASLAELCALLHALEGEAFERLVEPAARRVDALGGLLRPFLSEPPSALAPAE